ncbi:MAG: hypothetical protein MJZ32_08620 [Bacteroidaceae bacterium]|nr:hypothetical protein [Bacteroidaceae bacterium]
MDVSQIAKGGGFTTIALLFIIITAGASQRLSMAIMKVRKDKSPHRPFYHQNNINKVKIVGNLFLFLRKNANFAAEKGKNYDNSSTTS